MYTALCERFSRYHILDCSNFMAGPESKTASAQALVGLWAIALTAFVIVALYFGLHGAVIGMAAPGLPVVTVAGLTRCRDGLLG